MKKIILTILICVFMVLGLSGCGTKVNNNASIKNQDNINNEEHQFKAKVIEVHEGYIIVEPNADEIERKSSDKFHIKNDNNVKYKKGQILAITYVGGINESYPAQIGVTSISIVELN